MEELREPSDYNGIVREALILQGKFVEFPQSAGGV